MVKPGEAGSWYSSGTPNPAASGGGGSAAPLGTLYVYSNAPGTAITPVGFSVDTDGSWGDWDTYLAFAGSTVTVNTGCFLSAFAAADISTPTSHAAQLVVSTSAWFGTSTASFWWTGTGTTPVSLTASTPVYPFGPGFTVDLRVPSAPIGAPATGIQWLTTVWAPTPEGFVFPE